jgi:DeoR family fructose operon transcriptional repressor
MTNLQGTLGSDTRLRWLSDRLGTDGSVTIGDAARSLGVSEMTIRRDLAELEDRGTARRVRGGARAIGPQTFAERRGTAVRAKSRIAAKLARLVPATGTVAFDASSTVMRVAADLTRVRDLTVITNGPDTFATLQGQAGVTALLTGGRLDARTGSLVGPLACDTASHLMAERLFVSAAAVDATLGPSEATIDEAAVKRAFATGAGEIVLAVASSKLDGRATAVSVDWDAVDLLVTELDPSDERLSPYRTLAQVM